MSFEVKVVLDSVAPCGKRLTTITCTSPRIILAEINTHRDRARNAASSRAIPFPVMTRNILDDPFVPIQWGGEQSGMQSAGPIPVELSDYAEQIWREALADAMRHATRLHNIGRSYNEYHRLTSGPRPEYEEVKIHKSIPNRLVEPWMWCTQVMTATEWNNFFRLRCHPDAEIHFQRIATMIRDALAASTPTPRKEFSWHLPFVDGNDLGLLLADEFTDEQICKISVSRCARVSYLTHEGKRDPKLDLQLFDRLVQGSGFGHWSAHEHVASACDFARVENRVGEESDEFVRSGPFIGWKQYRKTFSLENAEG